VLAELWTTVGKPIDAERLKVHQKALGSVPLELAVMRVIRENPYQVVPLPGVVWAVVRKELGNPYDVNAGIEAWCEERRRRIK